MLTVWVDLQTAAGFNDDGCIITFLVNDLKGNNATGGTLLKVYLNFPERSCLDPKESFRDLLELKLSSRNSPFCQLADLEFWRFILTGYRLIFE